MNKVFFCIMLLFAFCACTSADKIIPKDILPPDKMKIVVWDMVQAGELAATFQQKDTTRKKLPTGYLSEALKINNITKDVFFKSMNFYQQHPDLYEQLFDSVNAYGERERMKAFRRHQ